jgi:hypothetical protein
MEQSKQNECVDVILENEDFKLDELLAIYCDRPEKKVKSVNYRHSSLKEVSCEAKSSMVRGYQIFYTI